MTLILSNVRPWGEAPVDIKIEGELIAEIVPAGSAFESAVDAAAERIDGAAMVATPGLVNTHAHVDKTWWGMPWEPYAGEATTQGRIAHERQERDRLGVPSVDLTLALVREFVRHGTTAVRTHVDVDLGVGLRGIEVVREVERVLGGAITFDIVAFPQDGVVRRPGVLQLLDQAAAEGATAIGGIDPASLDRDPVGQLDGLFEIAERRGVGIDIHLHDGGELGAFQIELIIDRTLRAGLQGKVNVAHGFALGDVQGARQEALLDSIAEAGISWSSISPVAVQPLPWRGMLERGIPLGLGTDGIRDFWGPYGDGDMMRVALQFARKHGVRTDEDLAQTVALATRDAASFVSRPVHDVVVGSRAEIVLFDALNVQDALVRAPERALVIAGGRVVARDGNVLV